jgi:hypothetical protein
LGIRLRIGLESVLGLDDVFEPSAFGASDEIESWWRRQTGRLRRARRETVAVCSFQIFAWQ